MCDPITIAAIASAAATAGGNYLQTKTNNESMQAQTTARNNAAAEGVAQQQPNIQQGQQELNQTLQKFSAPQQSQDLGNLVAARSAAINANDPAPTGSTNPLTNINADTPQVVKSDLATKLAGATAYAKQQGDAAGAMGATSDLFNNQNIALNNNAQNLSDLNTKASEEAAVNRLKQTSDANNARKAPSTLGELLSTAGTVGSLASAAGGGFTNILNGAGQAAEGGLRAVSSLPPGPIPLTASGVWSSL